MNHILSTPTLLALLAIAGAFILLTGQSLPPVVASHFAADGNANGYMARNNYLGLMLFIAVGVPLLLALGHGLVRSVPPRFVNLPNRDYWLAPERAAETFSYLHGHGLYLSVLLAAFLCFIHWLVIRANALQPPRLDPSWFVAGLVVFLALVVAWVGVLIVHFRRRP